ncbi:MAG: GspH/FimT family protein [Mariprofundaceae bacterium]
MMPWVVRMRIGILSAGNKRSAGFTLLEVLVVLVIIGFAYTLVPPMFSSGLSGVEMKAAARKVAAGLRLAKTRSVLERKSIALSLDVEANNFNIGDDPRNYQLPETIELKLEAAESERVGSTKGAIRFYPDSTSTGGRVTLSLEDMIYMIDVDWLTGKVSIL